MGARSGARGRAAGSSASLILGEALGMAWLLLCLPVVLLTLNALRVKTCGPLSGGLFLLLGPVMGVALACCWGACLGALLPRQQSAVWLAVLTPLASMAVGLYQLWATPAVFSFGHFYGYFPGTFYDRDVQIPETWLWLRSVDLVATLGLWAAMTALRDPAAETPSESARQHPVLTLGAIVAAASTLLCAQQAEAWGARSSSQWIASQLGKQVRSDRCILVVPRELDLDSVSLLAEDCDFQVGRVERDLGVKVGQPLTAFLFRSAEEKRRLMGAGRVYIAKPWRDEVYLQLSGWPHPVLGHEIAHLVAGRAGAGPFRIAGVLGGYWPEPTLIEGMAVALAWRTRNELTPHQWARAARDAKVAPSLRSLVGAGFFKHNQHLAYTLAGSFLRHVADTRGAEVLRAIYRSGDVAGSTGASYDELERGWHAALDKVALPPAAVALAQARFDRPGIFSQVCPHEVERLRLLASGALHSGDHLGAIERCQEILLIDPRNAEARAQLVGALARGGQPANARRALDTMASDTLTPRATVARARSELADAAFRAGDFKAARELFAAQMDQPQSEGARRAFEVKSLALDAPDDQRRWIGELLVGTKQGGTDPRIAVHAADQLASLREDGLGPYLLGRQLDAANRHELSHGAFTQSLERGLPLSRLQREAWRLRGRSAFALADWSDAERSFRHLAEHPDATEAQRLLAARWALRLKHISRSP